MSKSTELRLLRGSRSVDAPMNYRHRTGDSEGTGGSMLDMYAQVESAEEVIFEGEDELAKIQFLKGFKGYLQKVFNRQEREFLKRLMSGNEKPHEVGRALGVDWFKYMQRIQKKAYKNTRPLLKLSQITGWSRAQEFTGRILQRLSLDGFGLESQNTKLMKQVKRARLRTKRYCEEHREYYLAYLKKYREEHCEKIALYQKEYRKKNKEQIREKRFESSKRYREKNKEKIKKYFEENKEKIREMNKIYREKHCEKIALYQKRYREKNKEKLALQAQKKYQENKEYRKEQARKYREENLEKVRERVRESRRRKRAERMAEELEKQARQA